MSKQVDNKDKLDTKSRILDVANELFATRGFDGTSVRDIANEADVNLAAINYHFKNKENLYHKVFDHNYKKMEEGINSIAEREGVKAPEFAWLAFQMFMENKHGLLTSMKMIMTDHLNAGMCSAGEDDGIEMFGPPGWQAFLKVITDEVGEEVPFAARHWAMRMCFGSLVHFATMMSTSYVCAKMEELPFMKPEFKKLELERMTKALLNYTRENPNEWDDIDFQLPTDK